MISSWYGFGLHSFQDLSLDIQHHLRVAQSYRCFHCVEHALFTLNAVHTGNYSYFLTLVKTAPKQNFHLMLLLKPIVQKRNLRQFLFSGFPSIPISLLAVGLTCFLDVLATDRNSRKRINYSVT